MTSGDVRIAVFGLGEAGSLIAGDLAASGCAVRGFDPAPVGTPAGVERCADPIRAVEGVGVVLGITAAADAETALTQALDQIPRGCHLRRPGHRLAGRQAGPQCHRRRAPRWPSSTWRS